MVRSLPFLMSLTLCSFIMTGCDGDPPDGDDASSGSMDAGTPDTGTPEPEPWVGPGCDVEAGVECDGDWSERCEPGCAESECCAPRFGEFVCVPREEDGACPMANLWLDTTKIDDDQIAVEWRFFPEDDCAIQEGCVQAAGWRRLLRFGTWTPNTGNADLYLGAPTDTAAHFEYSECHDHYHFNGYAEYELRTADGAVAAEGHKQAFCLLDFYRYPEGDERGLVYDCDNQGIQNGYQDVYDADLDCQWVDVTDVVPGEYNLHIELNTERTLLESDYSDNSADVTITIPEDTPPVITDDCGFLRTGVDRDCGWTRDAVHTCTAGDEVTVGCSDSCSLGSCTGDTVLRVCEGDDSEACYARAVTGNNDDSGCADGEDRCSQLTFTCPESGNFVVYVGPYDVTDTEWSCSVGVMTTPPVEE